MKKNYIKNIYGGKEMTADEQLKLFPKDTVWIYESPDGGATIYRRKISGTGREKLSS